MTRPSSRLRPVAEVSAADWVVEGVGPFGSGVGALVPHGFAAYARILHPAVGPGGEPVRWADVAAWSGRVVHPRAQFAALRRPVPGAGTGRAPWAEEPPAGELPGDLLAAAGEVLAGHTGTPGRCWFCAWEGYGWISGARSAAVVTAGRERPVRRGGTAGAEGVADDHRHEVVVSPAFPAEVAGGPRVRLPERAYFLLEGPLDAVGEMGWLLAGDHFERRPPNLFWPADRAWCVATEVDLDSTYVGGSEALVRALLGDRRLEVLRAAVTDPVWADSDDVNG